MKTSTRETLSLALMATALLSMLADGLLCLSTIKYAGCGFIAALILILIAAAIAE